MIQHAMPRLPDAVPDVRPLFGAQHEHVLAELRESTVNVEIYDLQAQVTKP